MTTLELDTTPGIRSISIRTFGTFELSFDDQQIQRWRAGKARSLLQFLLLRPGRVVSRETLHSSLWPDAPWSNRSSSLKVAAHMLRKLLDNAQQAGGQGAVLAGRPRLRLVSHECGYALDSHGAWVDFEVFGQLMAEARTAHVRGDHRGSRACYRQAVELYRDEFLVGEPYEWAAVQRELHRSELLCALLQLAESDLRGGHHLGVLQWCRQLLDVDPLHEEAYRALILLHGHLGQRAQVQRWYGLCAEWLDTHLQVAPSPTTRRLYTRALAGSYAGRAMPENAWREVTGSDHRPTVDASLG